jgi:hypothetical protein
LLLFIVYTFGALAKLYPDWLAGHPVAIWFANKADLPILGPVLQLPWVQQLVVWGGIGYDGLIVPLLLLRPTRWLAVGLSLVFHLFNSVVFQIGIFPYLMLLSLVLFFPPGDVRRRFFPGHPQPAAPTHALYRQGFLSNRTVLAMLAVFFAIQIALPLRHWTFPGTVHWSEEGHRMSWQMMLRSKSGQALFYIVDKETGRSAIIDQSAWLTDKQRRKVATHPDMAWQFARYLKEHYAAQGRTVEVHARGRVRLNRRPAAPLYDSEVDLASVPWRRFRSAAWILPAPSPPEF